MPWSYTMQISNQPWVFVPELFLFWGSPSGECGVESNLRVEQGSEWGWSRVQTPKIEWSRVLTWRQGRVLAGGSERWGVLQQVQNWEGSRAPTWGWSRAQKREQSRVPTLKGQWSRVLTQVLNGRNVKLGIPWHTSYSSAASSTTSAATYSTRLLKDNWIGGTSWSRSHECGLSWLWCNTLEGRASAKLYNWSELFWWLLSVWKNAASQAASCPSVFEASLRRQRPWGQIVPPEHQTYNAAFAFTSLGADFDQTLLQGHGPYVLKLHGELCLDHGSLLPGHDERPRYALLW